MWYSAVGCIVTLILSLLVAPLAAVAQQAKHVPRIGILAPTLDPHDPSSHFQAFRQGLRDLGYVEGQSIVSDHGGQSVQCLGHSLRCFLEPSIPPWLQTSPEIIATRVVCSRLDRGEQPRCEHVRATRAMGASVLAAHWRTSSAWKRSVGGIVRPSAWAVFRLITNANRVGRSTGRSAGFAPFKMRST